MAFDCGKNVGQPTALALSPDRGHHPSARLQHPTHCLPGSDRMGHIHQAQCTQGDIKAPIGEQEPLLSYLRYNVDLHTDSIQRLDPSMTDTKVVESLSAMDAPENIHVLHKLGKPGAERDVKGSDFPSNFDLPTD